MLPTVLGHTFMYMTNQMRYENTQHSWQNRQGNPAQVAQAKWSHLQSAASEKLALENGVMRRSRMRQHTAIHGAMVNDASMNATWQEASAAMSTCTATARGQEKENTDMGGTWPRPHSQQPGLAAGQNSPMFVTWEIRSTPPILT